FTTPYLLVDRDDGGRDDTDEWWQLDARTGEVSVGPQRLAFTCALPKETDTVRQPFPVAMYGHGHGSTRFESLLLAWAGTRMGVAMCGIEWPGHGIDISPEEVALFNGLLDAKQLGPTMTHLLDGRARDLNNDGRVDSGGDQWISDPFHSSDMVRQGVIDWIQFVRALRQCGTGEMDVLAEDGDRMHTTMACDWDENGVPDIGGPDVQYYSLGGSLGGINSAVAAAVMPELSATATIVPGGGLLDVGIRSDLGGVVSAVLGRMLTPLILGLPNDAGGLSIVQEVNQYMDMEQVPIATLASVPAGGRIVVENLDNGETREGLIPTDGRLRVAIPASAMSAIEKKIATGMPDEGPGAEIWSIPDNAGLGDRLVLTVYDASGAEVARIDSFEADTVYEGVTYPAGSPLVAASHGLGRVRGTPDFRRLVMATSVAMESGDPISYGPHWFLEPFEALGGKPANVLLQPGIGDQAVTISAGLALARAAGMVEIHEIDPRYGTTPDQWLIDHKVLQGLEGFGPYTDAAGYPALFDPDDLDLGADGSGVPSETPLRATLQTESGMSGLRLSYPRTTGMHGFDSPDPTRPFDTAIYVGTSVSWYLASGGLDLRSDPCMGSESCDDIPPVILPPIE
ncbi:MAG: hypothetical protein ABMA64_25905, partial [Myxococcota bacterium]